MEKDKIQFGEGVIAGLIVMILFAVVTVNIYNLVPLFGPVIGGIVAGAIAGKDFLNGAKAGMLAGFIGAVVVALDFMAHTGYLSAAAPVSAQAVGVLVFILALFYFPILSFIGGAAGGYFRK